MKISEIASGKIKICGRTTSCLEPLSLVWSGSCVELNVKASELKMLVEGPYNSQEVWIAIELNGEIISRRMIENRKEWVTVFRGMDPQNVKNVRIIKEGQAFEGDGEHRLNIYEIETDGELEQVEDKKLKLEFIGDSINSAEGCMGAKCEMDWIAQFFSHTNSYPYMVGKKMDADIQIVSQSGWGTYASWDCNENNVIPQYYEGIASLMQGEFFKKNGFHEPWDFTKWQPDAIIINLGTNDDGAFHNNDCANANLLRMDGTEYVEEDRIKVRDAMTDFLMMVRKNNPDAYIYWAFGMLGNQMVPTIMEAMDIYKKNTNDKMIGYIALPETDDDTVGARSHPGRKAHKKAAKEIVKVLKKDIP